MSLQYPSCGAEFADVSLQCIVTVLRVCVVKQLGRHNAID